MATSISISFPLAQDESALPLEEVAMVANLGQVCPSVLALGAAGEPCELPPQVRHSYQQLCEDHITRADLQYQLELSSKGQQECKLENETLQHKMEEFKLQLSCLEQEKYENKKKSKEIKRLEAELEAKTKELGKEKEISCIKDEYIAKISCIEGSEEFKNEQLQHQKEVNQITDQFKTEISKLFDQISKREVVYEEFEQAISDIRAEFEKAKN